MLLKCPPTTGSLEHGIADGSGREEGAALAGWEAKELKGASDR